MNADPNLDQEETLNHKLINEFRGFGWYSPLPRPVVLVRCKALHSAGILERKTKLGTTWYKLVEGW